jgi:hypothetical protein
MTFSPAELLTVIAGASGLVTAIWHAAMYVGKLTVRLERHEDRLQKVDTKLSDHDDELRFLKGLR